MSRPQTGSPAKSPKKWRNTINLVNSQGNEIVN